MSKSNTNNSYLQTHGLPAGLLPGDFSTELFGVRETRKVYGLCNGCTIPFSKVDPGLKALIFQLMLSDDVAMEDLKDLSHEEALEEYAFCLYGAADNAPDFTPEGKPGEAENFICGSNCRCLRWQSKKITINGKVLSEREVLLSNLLTSDMPDKQVADQLNIAPVTLDIHKRKLYEKAGVHSKSGFAVAAITHNIKH